MKKYLAAAALVALHVSSVALPQTAPVTASQASAPVAATRPTVVTLKRVNQAKPVPKPEAQTSSAALSLPLPKARAQTLPGLGNMPGEAADTRVKSVRVGSDRNELVYISLNQLNKVSTPYDSPQIIDATGAILKAVGQDLFLKPANDTPFTVYITNGGVGQSTGITLVPRANLPAQTIVLELDNPSPSGTAVSPESEEVVAGDYVSRINAIVKSLSLGKVPSGFTKGRLPSAVVTGKELVIQPQHKYSGSTYDVFAYKVRSISTTPLEMKEDAFYTETVRAVAFYPSVMLQTGEETTVFIIADRPGTEAKK